MKISPVASGGTPGQNIGGVTTERTSPDRIAAAKAIAAGDTPIRITPGEMPIDQQAQRAQESIKRIKMRVNRSPERMEMPQEVPVAATQGAQTDINEQSEVVTEETRPLSPQFAALMKQKRALQVKERELADREKALQSQPSTDGSSDLEARLKSQPLRVLEEQGVLTPEFFNSFTEYLTTGQSGVHPEINALKAEIKALKEGVDTKFTERDTQVELQVFNEMQREAQMLAKEGDAFELIRENRSVPTVMDLIKRTWKSTGEAMDVSEAMQLVEDELLKDQLRIARFKKIQSQLTPTPSVQTQPRQMIRTLTNRDTATPPMDRRTRAMMAAIGSLKR